MTENKMISVIVPVYNEELVLPLFHERMNQVMDGLKDYNWKVINNIEQKKVEYVLWDTVVADSNLKTWFPQYKQPSNDNLYLER